MAAFLPQCRPAAPASPGEREVLQGSAQSLASLGRVQTVAAPALAAPSAPPGPVQLLRVQRKEEKWWYEVCEEGAKMLERYGNRRIAVVSICGLYRTGKSYILNLLLERIQKQLPLFQVGSTSRACTEGLWLYGSLNADASGSPLLAFVDCEGFGSTQSDRTRDAQLMTLCALLSSVLVLNTKGALNEGLFNALALTCRFAEHVEDRGNEASRPELLWVLRDFQLDLVDASNAPISPSEYLENALRAAPATTRDVERGQAAHEVRQSLLRFFSQRSCATLVRPAEEEEDLQQLDRLQYSALRSEFRAGVEALRTKLIATCHSQPKLVGGQAIGCVGFVALMRQLVGALNDNAVLSVRGAWDAVQHTTCAGLLEELRGKACGTLRLLAKGQAAPGGAKLPMADDALAALVRSQRAEAKALWDRQAVGDEGVRAEYWQELEEAIDAEEASLRQKNTRLADEHLQRACKSWLEWLDRDRAAWSGDGERISSELLTLMQGMPSPALCRAAQLAIQAAGKQVSKCKSTLAENQLKFSEDLQQMKVASSKTDEVNSIRKELEKAKAELEATQEKLRAAVVAGQGTEMELQARDTELRSLRAKQHDALTDLDAMHTMEHELKAQLRMMIERDGKTQAELERLIAENAKAEADRQTGERALRMARLDAEASGAVRVQAEASLKDARARLGLAEEELKRSRADRETLQGDFDRARREEEEGRGASQKEREAERAELRQSREQLKALGERVEAREAELRGAREQLQGALADVERARAHEREEVKRLLKANSEKEASLREDLAWAKDAAVQAESKLNLSEKAARKARWEADTAAQEAKWLEGELKRLAHGQM
ncbi:unnamed protein product [Prorocentrum cordatum]|uniref:GB1/RHD3-type G domain-containing protein n=1 Tax=Prorocentrum cordatum TaxID=2364126 RepID=A0ABN9XDV4_9DINO|nr:unnamed protein product [Polarella glacialis]